MISNDTCTYLYILRYEKSWFFFPAEDSGVSSGAVPSAPPLPTISENEEEEPLLEEDFSVALLEDDQRDFEAGMVVSTSKVGILWKKNLSILKDFLSREKLTQKWLMPKVEQYAKHQLKLTKTPNSHWFYLDLNDQKTSHFYWSNFWLWFIRRNWFAKKILWVETEIILFIH